MKGKTLLSLAIALSIVLTVMPTLVSAAPEPKIYVIPDGSTWNAGTNRYELIVPPGGSPHVCEEFRAVVRIVDCNVEGAFDGCWSWMIRLRWDPAVLNVTARSKVTEGGFLKNVNPDTSFRFWDPRPGELPEVTCRFNVEAEATGSGDLFYVMFHVVGVGSTEIEVYEYDIIDYDGDPIPATTLYDGYYELQPPPPTAPQARFTPAHCTVFYVGDWITLDGRASSPGWDTLPAPGNSCPITTYTWQIDIGNDGSVEMVLFGAYIENAFQCEAPGDVKINLTVYAPDPIPETHPDYDPYDTEIHVIHQITRPVGVVIDVYTEKGGEGPGINPDTHEQFEYPTNWADAFAPQEEVTVYAKVTYNDDPVQNKPVAFEVKDETGTAVLYRTAFTNSEGIATIDFRLIWECTKVFGAKFEVWEIFASVSVSEIVAMDVCKFRYGWLVQIDEIIAPSSATKCTLVPIVVDLNNICYTDQTVFVAVVIYDDCGVPIGFATLPDWTVFANDGLTTEMTIHIPKWAYLGTGTIYANVFTGPPQLGGVPMCPEAEALIILQKP